MIQHLETGDLEELKALIQSHTDQEEVVENAIRFTLVAVEGAIAAEVERMNGMLPDPDGIKTIFKLHNGSYVWLAHLKQRVPGIRYEVIITMPSAEKYDACCYFTQGTGGKLIDILTEDQITAWTMD